MRLHKSIKHEITSDYTFILKYTLCLLPNLRTPASRMNNDSRKGSFT